MTDETRKNLQRVTGRVHHTESFGAVDGPGIRFVIFLQGCPLRCLYCHNPDAICRRGGEIWTAERAAEEAMRYIHFIRKGGVTFSGGEPLLQAEFLHAAILLMKEKGLHTAIDTAGSLDPQLPMVKAAIDSADMLLLDIKAADDETAKRLTGRPLTNAFATLDYCEKTKKPVWIRHVLVEGYTLDSVHTERLAQRLKGYSCIERVELLPFHKLGEDKWAQTDMQYQLSETPATTPAQVEEARAILKVSDIT